MALIKIEPYIIDSTGNFTFDAVEVTGNLSSLNANLGNLVQANYFTGTLTTNAQPNITSTGTLTSLTVSGTSNLGPVGNVTITGGTSGQYLQTDGSGTLSWATVAGGSSSNISNGNSNVNIPAANGNVNISSAGNANILVVTGTGANITGTLNVTGNATVGNLITSGSGGNISNVNVISANTFVASGNVTANNFVTSGSGGNITGGNVISANTFTASGNITAGNASLGNAVTANYFIGNFYGTANSATTSGTVTTNAQPNITSVGTLSSLAITGNITSGNANLGNNVSANFFTGNGVYLTGITTSGLSNGNSNVNIPAANGNINFTAVGNTTMVVTGTGVNVAGTLNATGNVSLGNLVTTGSGGNISNANVISANTLTASGTINGADLSLSGNGVFGGNLTVNGTLTYINSTTLSISDPIINLQTGANGAAPTSNSGKDVGTALNYYDTSAKIAWMGWDVSNAEIAFGSNVGISSEVVTFTSLANIRSGNASLGNAASANYFIGNFYGTANSATTAGTVTTAAQPNITSVGTLSGLTGTGTIDFTGASNTTLGAVGNVHITGGSSGQYLQTDGSGTLTWATVTSGSTSNISNGNSNVNIPSANGNVNISAVGNANVLVITGTGANITGTANITGNLIAGNIIAGNGSGGNISNANVISANTLTASGNVNGADLNLSGNGVFGGNLTVNGTLTYINSTTLSISDPIINLQTGANGAAPTSNSGKDVGTALNYYDTSAKIAWMGWDVSNAEIAFGSNVGISSEVVTFTSLANIRSGNASLGNAASANYFIGNFYGTANSATTATTAGTVTTAAQPNITSVGTLSSLTVTGNVDAGNINAGSGSGGSITGGNLVSANYFTGTLTTAAQPNITSVGSLTGLTVSNATGVVNFTTTANVTLGAVANLHISGGTNAYVLSTDGAGNLSWVAQSGGGGGSNISNGNSNVSIAAANGNITMSAEGNANIVTVTGTGVNVAGTLNTTGNVALSGANVTLGAVGNLHITGGSNTYVLSTDGAGNLSWTSPPAGANVTVDNFTGNGVQTVFTLSTTPIGINQTSVNYNGATVLRTDYTLANANITFSSAPADGSLIEVTTINLTSGGGGGGTSTAAAVGYSLIFGG